MRVSIVVPCYNEEKNIQACLRSLVEQDYAGDFEIIAVDNHSTDKTQDIIKEFGKKHSLIRLIVEPKKGTAYSRNTGVNSARYEYIAFIDADCLAPRDWLSVLVRNFRKIREEYTNVIAVGGRNIAPDDANPFTKAVEVALDSYIGSFSSIQGRQFKKPAFVSSISTVNALYEKNKLIEVGGFDESLYSEAEDAELNYRLFSAGNKFLYVPESFVWHKMRSSPQLWLKNMFRYGKGRARLLKRYPQMWRFSFVLPMIFMLALFSVLFSVFFWMFALPLLYFPFIVCVSFFQAFRKKSLHLVLFILVVYLLQHFGYAAGEIYGLVHPRIK